jgi:integrase/recombinase XerD
LGKFRDQFLERELESITSEEILSFLTSLNDSCKQLTKHTRYAYLKALFNFIRTNLDNQLQNPCNTPMLKKLFRPGKLAQWQIHEKETIDEIIFRTTKVRNRLMLELMARGGMRVGEVLKLTALDVDDQKLTIKNPKSGKTSEVVFIPKKLADRLKDYLKARGAEGNQRISPITYTAARVMVNKAGALVGST